jgi:hypothetical protein
MVTQLFSQQPGTVITNIFKYKKIRIYKNIGVSTFPFPHPHRPIYNITRKIKDIFIRILVILIYVKKEDVFIVVIIR